MKETREQNIVTKVAFFHDLIQKVTVAPFLMIVCLLDLPEAGSAFAHPIFVIKKTITVAHFEKNNFDKIKIQSLEENERTKALIC